MLTSIPSLILLGVIANDTPGLWTRLEPYLDYPGFEAWKFVNLAIFVGIIVYIARRKRLSDVFRDRRESIQRELAQAQQERDAAVAKLKEVEERLARLDAEVAEISERSKREAAEERERITRSTETEIAKLGEEAPPNECANHGSPLFVRARRRRSGAGRSGRCPGRVGSMGRNDPIDAAPPG